MSTADQPPAPKTPRRRSKAKKSGASVSDLILKAVSSSTERGGMSLVALKKALSAAGYDVVRNNARVRLAVKRLVANGRLIQTKGTGASGSFKSGSKAATKPKKPKAKKAKRAKKRSPKKPTGAKKSPKKRRRSVKSAEKASDTPAVKKSPKPKRAKRRVSKKGKARTAKK